MTLEQVHLRSPSPRMRAFLRIALPSTGSFVWNCRRALERGGSAREEMRAERSPREEENVESPVALEDEVDWGSAWRGRPLSWGLCEDGHASDPYSVSFVREGRRALERGSFLQAVMPAEGSPRGGAVSINSVAPTKGEIGKVAWGGKPLSSEPGEGGLESGPRDWAEMSRGRPPTSVQGHESNPRLNWRQRQGGRVAR